MALQKIHCTLVLHGAHGRAMQKKCKLAAGARSTFRAQCFGKTRLKWRPNCPWALRHLAAAQGNTKKGILRSWMGRAWRPTWLHAAGAGLPASRTRSSCQTGAMQNQGRAWRAQLGNKPVDGCTVEGL